ncbi:UNVERIFIED_CONTAM: hypothetical protein FKN15_062517 [Acipenser sinensis]
MQLKEEFRTYEALRREHDSQIVQIAMEGGLRIAPDQWSSLLYGDQSHKSHMQSIIDKLFVDSEILIADAPPPTWEQLEKGLVAVKTVVHGLVDFIQNHSKKGTDQQQPPQHSKYKTYMCRDMKQKGGCPRGASCTFAHSQEELEKYRKMNKRLAARRPLSQSLTQLNEVGLSGLLSDDGGLEGAVRKPSSLTNGIVAAGSGGHMPQLISRGTDCSYDTGLKPGKMEHLSISAPGSPPDFEGVNGSSLVQDSSMNSLSSKTSSLSLSADSASSSELQESQATHDQYKMPPTENGQPEHKVHMEDRSLALSEGVNGSSLVQDSSMNSLSSKTSSLSLSADSASSSELQEKPELSRNIINEWITNKTENRIQDVIPEGALDANTALVLVNTIYFKGNWKSKFDKENVFNGEFYRSETDQCTVSMMYQETKFRYGMFPEDKVKVLELPYKGDDITMVLIRPNDGVNLAEVESSLDLKKLVKWMHAIKETTVAVQVPRFSITDNFSLKDKLQSMGLRDLFDPNKCSLPGEELQ